MSTMSDNVQIVFNAIKKAGKPVKAGDVAESTSIDKKEVAKIIKELKKQGKITSPKNCFYAPAE
jgi:DNA-binding IscR family transcriptional regulator